MLVDVPGELVLKLMENVAREYSANAWLLNFGCRHDFVDTIVLRVNGRLVVAATRISSLGELAVRPLESELATGRLGLTLLLVWHEGLFTALPSNRWHIFVRVGF